MDLLDQNTVDEYTTVTFTLPDGTTKISDVRLPISTDASGKPISGVCDNAKADLVFINHPAFFQGETALSNGVYYLQFPDGHFFGYYAYLPDEHYLFHYDLGYIYVLDAADGQGGIYFYLYKTERIYYSSSKFPFPYLYDFDAETMEYLFPDSANDGHYLASPYAYFYAFDTGVIFQEP